MVMDRCRALLQQIPASDITQVFGSGELDIDVKFPQIYKECKLMRLFAQLHAFDSKTVDVYLLAQGECAIRFTMTEGPVRYQWHKLWAAAVATTWMCASQGEAGLANLYCMCLTLSASTGAGDRAC